MRELKNEILDSKIRHGRFVAYTQAAGSWITLVIEDTRTQEKITILLPMTEPLRQFDRLLQWINDCG